MNGALPGRDPAEEDAFVQSAAEMGPEVLSDWVRACLAARRPRLAARLVVLIPDDVDDDALIAARRAAAMWLAGPADHAAAADWTDAFAAYQRRRTRIFRPSAWRRPR